MDTSLLFTHWWSPVIRGVIAIAFGLMALAVPGISLLALIVLFGAYALAAGIANIVAFFRKLRTEERWWGLLLEGIVGIAAGLVTLFWPHITAVALLFVIAAWAIASGFLEVITAVRVRKLVKGEWLLALSGVLSIAFGVLLLSSPHAGLLVLVYLVGIYALMFGVLLIAFGIRIHSFDRQHPKPAFA
jgi:uncharacterized membrane protein HdeD (DUF308 family)